MRAFGVLRHRADLLPACNSLATLPSLRARQHGAAGIRESTGLAANWMLHWCDSTGAIKDVSREMLVMALAAVDRDEAQGAAVFVPVFDAGMPDFRVNLELEKLRELDVADIDPPIYLDKNRGEFRARYRA